MFNSVLDYMKLNYVRTLEFFEGDLLTEMADENGQVFLKKWADRDTWVITPASSMNIYNYMLGGLSLFDLMFSNKTEVLIYNDKTQEFVVTPILCVPRSYLCSEEAYHDTDLRVSF